MNIIGDVSGRRCILFDDIVDSAGTLCNAAKALVDQGAESVSAYVSHGVLSGAACERVMGERARRTGRHRHHRAVGTGQRLQQGAARDGGAPDR